MATIKKNESYCCGCDMFHNNSHFYKSYSPHFKLRETQIFCKNYITDYVRISEEEYSRDRLVEICRIMDVPYISHVWEKSKYDSRNKNPIQAYFAR